MRTKKQVLAFGLAWMALAQSADRAWISEERVSLDRTRRAAAGVERPLPRLPMVFEKNMGQADSRVDFLARRKGARLELAATGLTLTLRRRADSRHQRLVDPIALSAGRPVDSTRLHLGLVGANSRATAVGIDRVAGKSHYFQGRDPGAWRADIPNYSRVRYVETYPGIDLVVYGASAGFEYDFVVSPAGRPERIGFEIRGGTPRLNGVSGAIEIATEAGVLVLKKPVAYQDRAGREEVPVSYRLDGGRVSLDVGSYDEKRPLVIDPVLDYATYLGGSDGDFPFEFGFGIHVDTAGNVYVAGETDSTDFPSPGPTGADVFVVKLDPQGELLYSAVLGGSNDDVALALAVSADGRAVVAGLTESDDFPTRNAFQGSFAGGRVEPGDPLELATDAFVAVVSADGSSVDYASYAGGAANDLAFGVAIDGGGKVHVAGWTSSSDFPTRNAWQPDFRGPSGFGTDAFFFKVDPARVGADTLRVSTYVGGSGNDVAFDVAADPAGNSYVAGVTTSADLETVSALQPALAGGQDGMVFKVNPAGTSVSYLTYLGGAGSDLARAIAVDTRGGAYVGGVTFSTDFPLKNPFQAENRGRGDAYLARLSTDGRDLVFSSYFGGQNHEEVYGLALDASGLSYLSGSTSSTAAESFPAKDAIQGFGGGLQDAFLARWTSAGTLDYATPLGGSGDEVGLAVAADSSSSAFVTGWTSSSDFPVTPDALQPSLAGGIDAFLARIDAPPRFVIEVLVFLDVRCDGRLDPFPDAPLPGALAFLRRADGGMTTALTDAQGRARFEAVDVPVEGLRVGVRFPDRFQNHRIRPCAGSPTQQTVFREDFDASRVKRIDFTARFREGTGQN